MMIDWLKRAFGTTGSSSTAKERLRLVLMTDHLALAPEIIENMKRDLVDVISRYVEVDRSKVEVNFEREDRALAMLANIPIVAVNRPAPPPPAAPPEPPSAASEDQGPPEAALAAVSPPQPAPAAATPGAPPVRRRRRRPKPPIPKPAPANG
jgi:cell division topological specificity factor